MASRRGVSLIEVVVYAFLTAIVLLTIYAVLAAGMAYARTANTTTTLQEDLLRASERLEKDLAQSDAATITIGSTVAGLSFASPYDSNDAFSCTNGLLNWRKFVCFYVNARHQLVRVEKAITSTTSLPATTGYSPEQMASQNLPPRMMVGTIASIDVHLVAQTVSITLTAVGRDAAGTIVTDAGGNPMDSVTLQDANVVLRN